MVSKVVWCDRGWQPYYYGFCPDEKAWKRELKRLGVADKVAYPRLNGSCTHFANLKRGHDCSIVTIDTSERPSIQVIGLLVHEATHVWQKLCKSIGERRPSREFEAYSMQAIVQNLIAAYEQTRGPLFGKKVRK